MWKGCLHADVENKVVDKDTVGSVLSSEGCLGFHLRHVLQMCCPRTLSNWRGEGAVVVEPGQELVERRTQLLRRVGDRGLGELSETTKTIGQFGSSTESMPMEAA